MDRNEHTLDRTVQFYLRRYREARIKVPQDVPAMKHYEQCIIQTAHGYFVCTGKPYQISLEEKRFYLGNGHIVQ